jgi:phosphatidylserine/phosphatidylglycerophosphate/cardiolipin synthase-like enzyme
MSARELIKKYCTDQGGTHPGEIPPPISVDKMENHRTEAFIDGHAFFSAIRVEINNLIASTAPDRFFYLTAWWLGLSKYNGNLRIDDAFAWDYPANFPEVTLPGAMDPLAKRLERLADNGVVVRILPWVLPPLFITNKRLADNLGMKGVNFPTLISVSELRKVLPAGSVALNLLAHTFGAVHCKMVVCGDRSSMRAYTSGLDPQAGRLCAPGLSAKEIRDAIIRRYQAATDNEIKTQCDDLDNKILSKELYETFAQWNDLIPEKYSDFELGRKTGKYSYKIDLRWIGREWKLTFVEHFSDGCSVDTVFLQKDDRQISFRIWPDGGWHDVGVRVEGRAAGAIHDFFKAMWDEQLTRPVETFTINGEKIASHDRGCQPLPARQPIALAPNTGQQYVQVLRTIPEMNFTLTAKERGAFLVPDDLEPMKVGKLKIEVRQLAIPVALLAAVSSDYNRRPLSFAPQGRFEFKVALQKAISAAERYIFIADQGFWGLEVMDWINASLLRNPNLKVILLFGADPADPPNTFLSEAMNHHLLKGLPLDTDQQPTNVVFFEWAGNTVHCKVTIIDDVWCAIGSANCMRRSLYTDIELSVSILEPETAEKELPASSAEEANPATYQKKAPSFVQSFRRDLWAHYFGITLDPTKRSNNNQKEVYTGLLSLRHALQPWNPLRWRAPMSKLKFPPGPRPEISRQNLAPFPSAGGFQQKDYDRMDPDSRKPF